MAAFLADKVSFTGMSNLVQTAIEKVSFVAKPDYAGYVQTDAETRAFVATLIKS